MKSTKKIFNVASYNRNEQLVKMLESIYEQADEINVVLNVDNSDLSGDCIPFMDFLLKYVIKIYMNLQ